MASYLSERVEGTQQAFVNWGVGHKLVTTVWGQPAGMIMCAGGFAFEGDNSWLNQKVFCVDPDQVVASIAKLYPKEKFFAGVPGQTWHMKANKLASVELTTPWLGTTPRETWPSRAKGNVTVPEFGPATGQIALSPDDRARLVARLDDLAGSMVGNGTFRSLHSLLASETDRQLTFAIVLRDGDRKTTFEYVPTECRFATSEKAETAYLAGIELWASDLLAVLDGAIGPIALTFGRARLWNALPQRFSFEIFPELHRMSHPLRQPAAYLKTYERLWPRDARAIYKARQ